MFLESVSRVFGDLDTLACSFWKDSQPYSLMDEKEAYLDVPAALTFFKAIEKLADLTQKQAVHDAIQAGFVRCCRVSEFSD